MGHNEPGREEERWKVRRFKGWEVREAESGKTSRVGAWQKDTWRSIFIETLSGSLAYN